VDESPAPDATHGLSALKNSAATPQLKARPSASITVAEAQAARRLKAKPDK